MKGTSDPLTRRLHVIYLCAKSGGPARRAARCILSWLENDSCPFKCAKNVALLFRNPSGLNRHTQVTPESQVEKDLLRVLSGDLMKNKALARTNLDIDAEFKKLVEYLGNMKPRNPALISDNYSCTVCAERDAALAPLTMLLLCLTYLVEGGWNKLRKYAAMACKYLVWLQTDLINVARHSTLPVIRVSHTLSAALKEICWGTGPTYASVAKAVQELQLESGFDLCSVVGVATPVPLEQATLSTLKMGEKIPEGIRGTCIQSDECVDKKPISDKVCYNRGPHNPMVIMTTQEPKVGALIQLPVTDGSARAGSRIGALIGPWAQPRKDTPYRTFCGRIANSRNGFTNLQRE